jgi:CBS-domain-containing membrane protein
MSATVRDIMTTKVIAVKRDADFKEIVTVLRRFRVSACPVIDDAGRIHGVVSEADLLYKSAEAPAAGPKGPERGDDEESKADAVTAAQLMTTPAITVFPGVSVAEAAQTMHARHVKRLPVVTGDGKLVGIVSRADVLSVYERPDADIRDEVSKIVLATEFGLNPAKFEVAVNAGIVTIAGTVDCRETGLRLLSRVRHLEGVVAARDRLHYREPR